MCHTQPFRCFPLSLHLLTTRTWLGAKSSEYKKKEPRHRFLTLNLRCSSDQYSTGPLAGASSPRRPRVFAPPPHTLQPWRVGILDWKPTPGEGGVGGGVTEEAVGWPTGSGARPCPRGHDEALATGGGFARGRREGHTEGDRGTGAQGPRHASAGGRRAGIHRVRCSAGNRSPKRGGVVSCADFHNQRFSLEHFILNLAQPS